jgi:hypothetical protein
LGTKKHLFEKKGLVELGANRQLITGFGPGYLKLGLILRTGTQILFFERIGFHPGSIFFVNQNCSNFFSRMGTRGSSPTQKQGGCATL